MEGQLTFLGTGTSMGVPTLGCDCAVCTSADPRDKRLRPSLLLRWRDVERERVVLIDAGPDFREQALRNKLTRVDAVFYTHGHADHIMGRDDVRPCNFHQGGAIPIYGSEPTLSSIQCSFRYIFENKNPLSTVPKLTPVPLNGASFDLFVRSSFTRVPASEPRSITVTSLPFTSMTAWRRATDSSSRQVGEENASVEKVGVRQSLQRYGCVKPSTTLRKSASSSIMRSIFSTECMTVEWCLSLKRRPISGYDSSVNLRQRYIATWRGKATGLALDLAFMSETRSP